MNIKALPDEILVQIFRALRDMHVDARSHRWIVVTHICQDWRLVAMDAAELWTQIYSLDIDCVRAFVQRSKQALVDVDYPIGDLNTDSVIEVILTQSHRLHSISAGSVKVAHPFLIHPFTCGAPLLTSLELSYYTTIAPGVAYFVGNPSLALPPCPEICRQGLPALRRLHLTAWPVASIDAIRSLISPMLRSLTILSPRTRQPLNTWVAILTELPLLEVLHLRRVLLPAQPTPESPKRSGVFINLPNLTDLALTDNNDDATDQISLLQQIVPSKDLRLVFSHAARDPSQLPSATTVNQCLEAVSEKFKDTVIRSTFLHAQLSREDGDGIAATLVTSTTDTTSHDCPRHKPFDTPNSTILELNFKRPHGYRSRTMVCSAICDMLSRTFPMSKLATLRLDSCANLESWIAAIQACKTPLFDSIRVLALHSVWLDSDLFRILSVLVQGPTGSGNSSTEVPWPVSFPALEVLSIEIPDRHTIVDWDRLWWVLSSRGDTKHPLARVHICRTLRYWEEPDKLLARLCPLAPLDCRVDYCALKRDKSGEREIHSIWSVPYVTRSQKHA